MERKNNGTTNTLQSAYDEQYSDNMVNWRELGGKYKAKNILRVCEGMKFSKVLDCGAGEGSILQKLDDTSLSSDFYALEISDSGISQINKRGFQNLREVKKFDGYNIPYSDKEFEMAYCSHVIEHVEHPRLLLRELKRVSKYQVFEIPLDYSINADHEIVHFLSYGHISLYTPTTFRFLLKSEGYKIIKELLSHVNEEVIRFNWYQNLRRKKSLTNELKLRFLP